MRLACYGFLAFLAGGCPRPVFAQPLAQASPYPLAEESGWHGYFAGLASPIAVVGSLAGAAIGQGRDSPREWGQGTAGYGTRFASSFGEHIVQQTILSGTASLLREDTRYVVSGESGFKPRLRYALASTFLARSRDGSRHVSLSKLGAFTGGSFISRVWQPPSTGQPHNAAINLGVSVAVAAGINVAHEFLPRLFERAWLGF